MNDKVIRETEYDYLDYEGLDYYHRNLELQILPDIIGKIINESIWLKL